MCASVDISGGRCVSVEFCSFDLPLILLKYLLSFENLISFLLFVRMCADIRLHSIRNVFSSFPAEPLSIGYTIR